ncbi:hypothetical protein MMJ09_04110 [Bacillus vallismortis]|nr:hypothetical protein [Bacillus vallismortis]
MKRDITEIVQDLSTSITRCKTVATKKGVQLLRKDLRNLRNELADYGVRYQKLLDSIDYLVKFLNAAKARNSTETADYLFNKALERLLEFEAGLYNGRS